MLNGDNHIFTVTGKAHHHNRLTVLQYCHLVLGIVLAIQAETSKYSK